MNKQHGDPALLTLFEKKAKNIKNKNLKRNCVTSVSQTKRDTLFFLLSVCTCIFLLLCIRVVPVCTCTVRVPICIKLCTTCGVYKDLPRCQTVYRGTAEGWQFMMMIVSMDFLTPQVQSLKTPKCFLRMLFQYICSHYISSQCHTCMYVRARRCSCVLAFLCMSPFPLTGFGVLGWAWRPRPNHTSSHWGRACIHPRGPTRSCCQMSLQQY